MFEWVKSSLNMFPDLSGYCGQNNIQNQEKLPIEI